MMFSDCWKCSGEEEGNQTFKTENRGTTEACLSRTKEGIFFVSLFHNNNVQFSLPSNPVLNLNILLGFFLFLGNQYFDKTVSI